MTDPFNCPQCGSHDYGLYVVPFGECVWCLKRERDTLVAEQTQTGEYVERLLADHEEEKSKLRRTIAARQAQIDRLMFEYCPDEMTEEQKQRWAQHQTPVSKEAESRINSAVNNGPKGV